MIKILLVGTGNVATQLAKNLDIEKYQINQIFSRNKKNAEPLIEFLNCHWSNDTKKILGSDMTIIAISDDNIKSVLPLLPKIPTMHTSGSIDMKILDSINAKMGKMSIFYGSQGIIKQRRRERIERIEDKWKMRSSYKSPSYTTNWNDILKVS